MFFGRAYLPATLLQDLEGNFLTLSESLQCLEGFPPAPRWARTAGAEGLDSPGWTSLEFHHQPLLSEGCCLSRGHCMFQGSFSFAAWPVGKHSQWVKARSVAGAASHSNPSPDCHKLIKISAHFSFRFSPHHSTVSWQTPEIMFLSLYFHLWISYEC